MLADSITTEDNLTFTVHILSLIHIFSAAVEEILDLSYEAFADNNINSAVNVEPLEQVIDALKEEMRTRHILRCLLYTSRCV